MGLGRVHFIFIFVVIFFSISLLWLHFLFILFKLPIELTRVLDLFSLAFFLNIRKKKLIGLRQSASH